MTYIADKVDQPGNSVDNARIRSSMYGFLSTLFQHEPTAELLDQIRDPEFQDALSRAGVVLPGNFFDQPKKQCLTDLEVEYARLFIGPGKHISPHESVHRQDEDSRLYGRATVAVKQFFEAVGFKLQPDYTGLPDHISVEFEFMQTLSAWESEAWENGDIELARRCFEIENQFLHEHLLNWIPNFCTKLIEEADLSFYREIAKLVNDFIDMEIDQFLIARTGLEINESFRTAKTENQKYQTTVQ